MVTAIAMEPKSLDPTSLLWAHRLQRQHAALVSRIREIEAISDDHSSKLGGADTATATKIAALTARLEASEKQNANDSIDKKIDTAVAKTLGDLVDRVDLLESRDEAVGIVVGSLEKKLAAFEADRTKVFEREKHMVKRLGELEIGVLGLDGRVRGLVEEGGEERFEVIEADVRGLRELGKSREGEVRGMRGNVARAMGVVEGLQGRLEALNNRVGELVEPVGREREYLAMELQRLEKMPVTQSSSSNVVVAKAPAKMPAKAVPASESASMLTARDRPISSDANVAEVMQARMADREVTPPLPVRGTHAPQKPGAPPRSVAGSTRTNKVRDVPVRKAAVQPTKEKPAATAAQTQATRKQGRPRKEPVPRQPTALTYEALKDHDSHQQTTQASHSTGRKRKAAASIAPSERVTRSARTQATQMAELPMDKETAGLSSRKPRPASSRAPAVPRPAHSRGRAPAEGTRAANTPALWPRQSTFEESAELLQAMQQPPKQKGRRTIQIED